MPIKNQNELHTKNSDSALILLNGPNLDLWLSQKANASKIGLCDVFGFSTLALTSIPLDFFLYEPYHLPSLKERIELEDIYEQIGLCAGALTEKILSEKIAKSSSPKIYHNPPSCIESDKEMRTYYRNGIYPNYYFVDELDQFTTIRSLRYYFMSGQHLVRPLNYRCSMIRSISLCTLMGYKDITIAGLNPSIGGAWYDKKELISDLLRPKDEVVGKYLRLYKKIRAEINNTHLKITAEGNDFTKNQAYCLCIFLFMLKRFGKFPASDTMPQIIFHTDDKLIQELFKIFGIDDMIYKI